MKKRAILLVLGLPCVAVAQEYDLRIVPTKDVTLRTKIESTSESTTASTMLINGEERQGRGGRGGGGGERTTSASQTVEFDEVILKTDSKGNPLAVQRTYAKLAGEMTMPGRDGETTREVTGAIEGKKLHITMDDGEELIVHEKDADGEAVEARLIRGMQLRSDMAAMMPAEKVALQGEFDISDSLRDALKNLNHPIVEDTGAAPEGDRGGRRGQRGQRQGGFRGRGGMRNQALTQVLNDKLDLEARGKLVSIDEVEGVKLATIEIKAKVSAEGDPTELGLGGRFGRMGGGRGGRGGNQQAPEMDASASIAIAIEGKLIVNLDAHCLHSLKLEGESESSSEMSMTREMRGETMEMESSTESAGTFSYKISVKPVQ